MSMINRIFTKIWELIKKEFGFKRYHEITGLLLAKDSIGSEKPLKHEYRGITLWLKEIIESTLAIMMIVYFIYTAIHIVFWHGLNLIEIQNEAHNLLKLSGYVLIADSLLLIAALISSPGIDETIDSISVSLAGVFLLVLAPFADMKSGQKESLNNVLIPIAATIVVLIIIKHFLKWWSSNMDKA